MIVPASRLLWGVGLVVVPLATIAATSSAAAGLAITLILCLLAAALLDLSLGFGSLHGLTVELPKIVRLAKGRPGNIELLIHNNAQKTRRLRLGLPFPREIHSETEDLLAALPANHSLSKLNWLCTPQERGSYQLDKCYLETPSPWGFWAIRGACAIQAEIRVYPNLLDERKSAGALFLNRGNLGVHAHRQVGRGRDFEKLREYIPGDGYDEVHWKATAKRGRPITKVFQIERTQEVYVIIDSSRLTARKQVAKAEAQKHTGTSSKPETVSSPENTGVPVLERFINAALVLGMAAEQQGDLFGLITFSDRVQNFVRAKNGKSHYNACRDAIYALQPQVVTPDFDELCSFIRLRLRRRALLIVLTALDDPILAENFTRNLDLICRQHLILVNMFQPAGVAPVFSNPNVQSLDEVYRELAGHVRWHNLRELEKTLKQRGVNFTLLENEKMSAQLVTQYLDIKQRQLL